jgi:Polyketide cyclase / dehydrase and lipid transport
MMKSGIKRFRRGLRYATLATLAFAGMAAWGHAADQPGSKFMSMKSDLANREKDIHWPQGFDPSQADLFSHNELLINASCVRIWSHIIDANKWAEWYPNAKEIKVTGDTLLKDGTIFRWTTFGLPIESKVNEFAPYTRIGWYGYAPGTAPSFYHTWYLKPRGDACMVVTDEVGKGKDAAHLRESDEGLMHRGHDLWLATLKWVSEGK